MLKEPKVSIGALIVSFLILVPVSPAQVKRLKEFDLGPRADHWRMAVTLTNDILSFVARDTGEWELYRASDWLDQKPTIEKLSLPGFFSKRDFPIKTKDMKLFTSRDGKYAICVGSAEGQTRVRGRTVGGMMRDDVIAVVDLSSLQIVARTHTADLNLFPARGVTLDDDGYLSVESFTASGKGLPEKRALVRLSVPSLAPSPRCAYDFVKDSPGKGHFQATTPKECSEILKSQSLDDYLTELHLKSLKFSRPTAEVEVCQNNNSEFCRWPGEFTPDGRFGVAHRLEGNTANMKNKFVIFSTSRKVDIGEIKAPSPPWQSALISMAGKDYIAVLRSGDRIIVYQLQD